MVLCLIKYAGPHLCHTANSVIGDTLHLNPADSWLDLLKTWGWRKSHAGSKIDLGLHSEGKMKGIQSYHPPSHVSLQPPILSMCYSGVCPRMFSACDVDVKPGPRRQGLKQKCCQRFMASEKTCWDCSADERSVLGGDGCQAAEGKGLNRDVV